MKNINVIKLYKTFQNISFIFNLICISSIYFVLSLFFNVIIMFCYFSLPVIDKANASDKGKKNPDRTGIRSGRSKT